ncbi:hypothetical protein FHT86_002167 [Rhizobium sp. BK313]|nr:hypothetical protein [Rhizobium sp. BK313]
MTHTAITDDRRLEIENAVNRCIRHCRIGKVTEKVSPYTRDLMDAIGPQVAALFRASNAKLWRIDHDLRVVSE